MTVSLEAANVYKQAHPALAPLVDIAIEIGEIEVRDERKGCENENGKPKN